MLVDIIYKIQDNIHFQSSEIKRLENLIEALQDWPESPLSFDDYLKQLSIFLNTTIVSINDLKNSKVRKNPNSNELWEAESLTNLFRFMYANKTNNLQDLFEELGSFVPPSN
jgi:hypothetical protein